jgi:hypothetical protein
MNNFKQQDQLWNGIVKGLNNLSYVAAGAISLSITFLGYVLGITPSVRYILRTPVHGISTISILFSSWVLLFLTIFFGIIVQLFVARFLFGSQTAGLYEGFKATVREEDKKNVDLVINVAKASAEKHRIVSRCIQWVTIVSFALGMFTLTVFVVIVANGLVNA